MDNPPGSTPVKKCSASKLQGTQMTGRIEITVSADTHSRRWYVNVSTFCRAILCKFYYKPVYSVLLISHYDMANTSLLSKNRTLSESIAPFIQPVLIVSSSPIAEEISLKNGCTITEHLRPFFQKLDNIKSVNIKSIHHMKEFKNFGFRLLHTTEYQSLRMSQIYQYLRLSMSNTLSLRASSASTATNKTTPITSPGLHSSDKSQQLSQNIDTTQQSDVNPTYLSSLESSHSVFTHIKHSKKAIRSLFSRVPDPTPWLTRSRNIISDLSHYSPIHLLDQPIGQLLVISSSDPQPLHCLEQLASPYELPPHLREYIPTNSEKTTGMGNDVVSSFTQQNGENYNNPINFGLHLTHRIIAVIVDHDVMQGLNIVEMMFIFLKYNRNREIRQLEQQWKSGHFTNETILSLLPEVSWIRDYLYVRSTEGVDGVGPMFSTQAHTPAPTFTPHPANETESETTGVLPPLSASSQPAKPRTYTFVEHTHDAHGVWIPASTNSGAIFHHSSSSTASGDELVTATIDDDNDTPWDQFSRSRSINVMGAPPPSSPPLPSSQADTSCTDSDHPRQECTRLRTLPDPLSIESAYPLYCFLSKPTAPAAHPIEDPLLAADGSSHTIPLADGEADPLGGLQSSNPFDPLQKDQEQIVMSTLPDYIQWQVSGHLRPTSGQDSTITEAHPASPDPSIRLISNPFLSTADEILLTRAIIVNNTLIPTVFPSSTWNQVIRWLLSIERTRCQDAVNIVNDIQNTIKARISTAGRESGHYPSPTAALPSVYDGIAGSCGQENTAPQPPGVMKLDFNTSASIIQLLPLFRNRVYFECLTRIISSINAIGRTVDAIAIDSWATYPDYLQQLTVPLNVDPRSVLPQSGDSYGANLRVQQNYKRTQVLQKLSLQLYQSQVSAQQSILSTGASDGLNRSQQANNTSSASSNVPSPTNDQTTHGLPFNLSTLYTFASSNIQTLLGHITSCNAAIAPSSNGQMMREILSGSSLPMSAADEPDLLALQFNAFLSTFPSSITTLHEHCLDMVVTQLDVITAHYTQTDKLYDLEHYFHHKAWREHAKFLPSALLPTLVDISESLPSTLPSSDNPPDDNDVYQTIQKVHTFPSIDSTFWLDLDTSLKSMVTAVINGWAYHTNDIHKLLATLPKRAILGPNVSGHSQVKVSPGAPPLPPRPGSTAITPAAASSPIPVIDPFTFAGHCLKLPPLTVTDSAQLDSRVRKSFAHRSVFTRISYPHYMYNNLFSAVPNPPPTTVAQPTTSATTSYHTLLPNLIYTPVFPVKTDNLTFPYLQPMFSRGYARGLYNNLLVDKPARTLPAPLLLTLPIHFESSYTEPPDDHLNPSSPRTTRRNTLYSKTKSQLTRIVKISPTPMVNGSADGKHFPYLYLHTQHSIESLKRTVAQIATQMACHIEFLISSVHQKTISKKSFKKSIRSFFSLSNSNDKSSSSSSTAGSAGSLSASNSPFTIGSSTLSKEVLQTLYDLLDRSTYSLNVCGCSVCLSLNSSRNKDHLGNALSGVKFAIAPTLRLACLLISIQDYNTALTTLKAHSADVKPPLLNTYSQYMLGICCALSDPTPDLSLGGSNALTHFQNVLASVSPHFPLSVEQKHFQQRFTSMDSNTTTDLALNLHIEAFSWEVFFWLYDLYRMSGSYRIRRFQGSHAASDAQNYLLQRDAYESEESFQSVVARKEQLLPFLHRYQFCTCYGQQEKVPTSPKSPTSRPSSSFISGTSRTAPAQGATDRDIEVTQPFPNSFVLRNGGGYPEHSYAYTASQVGTASTMPSSTMSFCMAPLMSEQCAYAHLLHPSEPSIHKYIQSLVITAQQYLAHNMPFHSLRCALVVLQSGVVVLGSVVALLCQTISIALEDCAVYLLTTQNNSTVTHSMNDISFVMNIRQLSARFATLSLLYYSTMSKHFHAAKIYQTITQHENEKIGGDWSHQTTFEGLLLSSSGHSIVQHAKLKKQLLSIWNDISPSQKVSTSISLNHLSTLFTFLEDRLVFFEQIDRELYVHDACEPCYNSVSSKQGVFAANICGIGVSSAAPSSIDSSPSSPGTVHHRTRQWGSPLLAVDSPLSLDSEGRVLNMEDTLGLFERIALLWNSSSNVLNQQNDPLSAYLLLQPLLLLSTLRNSRTTPTGLPTLSSQLLHPSPSLGRTHSYHHNSSLIALLMSILKQQQATMKKNTMSTREYQQHLFYSQELLRFPLPFPLYTIIGCRVGPPHTTTSSTFSTPALLYHARQVIDQEANSNDYGSICPICHPFKQVLTTADDSTGQSVTRKRSYHHHPRAIGFGLDTRIVPHYHPIIVPPLLKHAIQEHTSSLSPSSPLITSPPSVWYPQHSTINPWRTELTDFQHTVSLTMPSQYSSLLYSIDRQPIHYFQFLPSPVQGSGSLSFVDTTIPLDSTSSQAATSMVGLDRHFLHMSMFQSNHDSMNLQQYINSVAKFSSTTTSLFTMSLNAKSNVVSATQHEQIMAKILSPYQYPPDEILHLLPPSSKNAYAAFHSTTPSSPILDLASIESTSKQQQSQSLSVGAADNDFDFEYYLQYYPPLINTPTSTTIDGSGVAVMPAESINRMKVPLFISRLLPDSPRAFKLASQLDDISENVTMHPSSQSHIVHPDPSNPQSLPHILYIHNERRMAKDYYHDLLLAQQRENLRLPKCPHNNHLQFTNTTSSSVSLLPFDANGMTLPLNEPITLYLTLHNPLLVPLQCRDISFYVTVEPLFGLKHSTMATSPPLTSDNHFRFVSNTGDVILQPSQTHIIEVSGKVILTDAAHDDISENYDVAHPDLAKPFSTSYPSSLVNLKFSHFTAQVNNVPSIFPLTCSMHDYLEYAKQQCQKYTKQFHESANSLDTANYHTNTRLRRDSSLFSDTPLFTSFSQLYQILQSTKTMQDHPDGVDGADIDGDCKLQTSPESSPQHLSASFLNALLLAGHFLRGDLTENSDQSDSTSPCSTVISSYYPHTGVFDFLSALPSSQASPLQLLEDYLVGLLPIDSTRSILTNSTVSSARSYIPFISDMSQIPFIHTSLLARGYFMSLAAKAQQQRVSGMMKNSTYFHSFLVQFDSSNTKNQVTYGYGSEAHGNDGSDIQGSHDVSNDTNHSLPAAATSATNLKSGFTTYIDLFKGHPIALPSCFFPLYNTICHNRLYIGCRRIERIQPYRQQAQFLDQIYDLIKRKSGEILKQEDGNADGHVQPPSSADLPALNNRPDVLPYDDSPQVTSLLTLPSPAKRWTRQDIFNEIRIGVDFLSFSALLIRNYKLHRQGKLSLRVEKPLLFTRRGQEFLSSIQKTLHKHLNSGSLVQIRPKKQKKSSLFDDGENNSDDLTEADDETEHVKNLVIPYFASTIDVVDSLGLLDVIQTTRCSSMTPKTQTDVMPTTSIIPPYFDPVSFQHMDNISYLTLINTGDAPVYHINISTTHGHCLTVFLINDNITTHTSQSIGEVADNEYPHHVSSIANVAFTNYHPHAEEQRIYDIVLLPQQRIELAFVLKPPQTGLFDINIQISYSTISSSQYSYCLQEMVKSTLRFCDSTFPFITVPTTVVEQIMSHPVFTCSTSFSDEPIPQSALVPFIGWLSTVKDAQNWLQMVCTTVILTQIPRTMHLQQTVNVLPSIDANVFHLTKTTAQVQHPACSWCALPYPSIDGLVQFTKQQQRLGQEQCSPLSVADSLFTDCLFTSSLDYPSHQAQVKHSTETITYEDYIAYQAHPDNTHRCKCSPFLASITIQDVRKHSLYSRSDISAPMLPNHESPALSDPLMRTTSENPLDNLYSRLLSSEICIDYVQLSSLMFDVIAYYPNSVQRYDADGNLLGVAQSHQQALTIPKAGALTLTVQLKPKAPQWFRMSGHTPNVSCDLFIICPYLIGSSYYVNARHGKAHGISIGDTTHTTHMVKERPQTFHGLGTGPSPSVSLLQTTNIFDEDTTITDVFHHICSVCSGVMQNSQIADVYDRARHKTPVDADCSVHASQTGSKELSNIPKTCAGTQTPTRKRRRDASTPDCVCWQFNTEYGCSTISLDGERQHCRPHPFQNVANVRHDQSLSLSFYQEEMVNPTLDEIHYHYYRYAYEPMVFTIGISITPPIYLAEPSPITGQVRCSAVCTSTNVYPPTRSFHRPMLDVVFNKIFTTIRMPLLMESLSPTSGSRLSWKDISTITHSTVIPLSTPDLKSGINNPNDFYHAMAYNSRFQAAYFMMLDALQHMLTQHETMVDTNQLFHAPQETDDQWILQRLTLQKERVRVKPNHPGTPTANPMRTPPASVVTQLNRKTLLDCTISGYIQWYYQLYCPLALYLKYPKRVGTILKPLSLAVKPEQLLEGSTTLSHVPLTIITQWHLPMYNITPQFEDSLLMPRVSTCACSNCFADHQNLHRQYQLHHPLPTVSLSLRPKHVSGPAPTDRVATADQSTSTSDLLNKVTTDITNPPRAISVIGAKEWRHQFQTPLGDEQPSLMANTSIGIHAHTIDLSLEANSFIDISPITIQITSHEPSGFEPKDTTHTSVSYTLVSPPGQAILTILDPE